jgi:predicted nucleotidyltransferase
MVCGETVARGEAKADYLLGHARRAHVAAQVKTNLDHLPEKKRDPITAIASVIRSRAPVEMVILFGSYVRGHWVEDLATRYFSDFDLMAVVETPEVAKDLSLWDDITAEIRRYAGPIPVTLVAHDVRELNHEIRMGQYFFADVVNDPRSVTRTRGWRYCRASGTAGSGVTVHGVDCG